MEPQKDFVRMLCKADDRLEVDDVMKTILFDPDFKAGWK